MVNLYVAKEGNGPVLDVCPEPAARKINDKEVEIAIRLTAVILLLWVQFVWWFSTDFPRKPPTKNAP